MKEDFIFTSESVTAGHPDKLCDGISDAIVDRFMQQDPFSKIVVESVVATGILFSRRALRPRQPSICRVWRGRWSTTQVTRTKASIPKPAAS